MTYWAVHSQPRESLAGMAVGIWDGQEAVTASWQEERRFIPKGDPTEIARSRAAWAAAVERA